MTSTHILKTDASVVPLRVRATDLEKKNKK